MKGIYWFLLLAVILIAGCVLAYEYTPVTVKYGTRYVCSECGKEYKSDLNEIRTARVESSQYELVTDHVHLCEVCKARKIEEEKQARIRREREEREARERAEKEELTRNLEVKFGTTPWGGSIINEVQLSPGSYILFVFSITNSSSSPLENVKLLVQPGEYLQWPSSSTFPEQYQEYYEWTQSGKNVGNINPSNSPYYKPGSTTYAFNSGPPMLKKDIKPGQDIYFKGYIIYRGQKIHVGTLTVHVMYPQ